jgi:hypothetical protein
VKEVLARAYDSLMDREGAAPVLAALANASAVVPVAELRQAIGSIGIGELRDLLMALQPLLLRVDPGTDDELVGFRHPTIAEHVRSRAVMRFDAVVRFDEDPQGPTVSQPSSPERVTGWEPGISPS